jgi:protein-L-isoaspartate(D-aspartate) O-methyltransferase
MMPADLRDSRDRMMVDVHIASRGIRDLRVLRRVPREAFVDADLEEFAYENNPLPIAEQQTISQPYIVALMVEAAEIGRQDRVLEIGAGSGYAAAVAAQLAKKVYAVERHASLVLQAAERFRKLGYSNVELRQGDGTLGWPDDGQFEVIMVAAGGDRIPPVRTRLARPVLARGELLVCRENPSARQLLYCAIPAARHIKLRGMRSANLASNPSSIMSKCSR